MVNAITAGTTSLFAYANGLISSAFGVPSAGNYAPVPISVDNLVLGGVPPAGALGFPPKPANNTTTATTKS